MDHKEINLLCDQDFFLDGTHPLNSFLKASVFYKCHTTASKELGANTPYYYLWNDLVFKFN